MKAFSQRPGPSSKAAGQCSRPLPSCRVLVAPRAELSQSQKTSDTTNNNGGLRTQSTKQGILKPLQQAATVFSSCALAGALVLSNPAASYAEATVVRLPASTNPEVFAAQRTLVEAWMIVGESFVDPDFNNLDWQDELRQHMMAAYHAGESQDKDGATKAWSEINAMLARLGDPYTRRIERDEYQQFRVSADGELQGIGLLIANELSASGHLTVLAPIKGGPADRAGILPGDEVVSIDGQDTQGWTGDKAAKVLRGRGGTEVHVKLARRTDGIPGVPSRPEPAPPKIQYKEVAMKRESVSITPVYSALLPDPSGGPPVGYVRLTQFSNNAANDMRQAVSGLEAAGADRYILDLRSNPGGLVSAGVEVASLWVDGDKPVFNVSSREGGRLTQTTESVEPAVTHDPLVVLVNNMSASASEIVSGALHDNGRAIIMGDTSTYGKGRIQSVFELQDGSALFVTVAKYQTPNGSEIDLRGVRPDRGCRIPAPMTAPPLAANLDLTTSSAALPSGATASPSSGVKNTAAQIASAAGAGKNIMSAPQLPADKSFAAEAGDTFMPGVPLDNSTEELLMEALVKDKCILAAESYLDSLLPLTANAKGTTLANNSSNMPSVPSPPLAPGSGLASAPEAPSKAATGVARQEMHARL